MTNEELIAELKRYPPDAIVGTRYGLGCSTFKTITYVVSHKAHIVDKDEILGETVVVHICND